MLSGFQKDKSSEATLLSVRHHIIDNFKSRLYTLGIFVDLRKVFDSVCLDVTLSKLEKNDVHGVVLKLIKSYLTNRCQYDSACDDRSNQIEEEKCVPPGFILGPLLFLMFVSDDCIIPHAP